MAQHRAVVLEADGASRGNPGEAAYGAVLTDAATGRVIAERGERIGAATNNVAEYQGLIAGLRLYRQHAEGADLEVRMDSRLVVEQMAGRWKVRHPSMKPLAAQAGRLAPAGTRWTWVPREQNAHADRLANEALDAGPAPARPAVDDDVEVAATTPTAPWDAKAATTLVLVRHGETEETRRRAFSGRTGSDPGLNDDGRAQVRATADWLAPLAELEPVLLSSPMRRTRESAEIVGARLGLAPVVDDGLVEAGFGAWEGLTYPDVLERDRDTFTRWLEDPSASPGGSGESLTAVAERVARTRERLLAEHVGRTVVAVSHLTPIKVMTAAALQMPLGSLFRTEISPASVTVVAWYPDGRPVVRLMNAHPPAWAQAAGLVLR